MQFLVHIESAGTPEGDEAFRADLGRRERERGVELLAAGTIQRLWRIAGRNANIGIWEAKDATELHAAISSLPGFQWQDVRVTALADHPLHAADPHA